MVVGVFSCVCVGAQCIHLMLELLVVVVAAVTRIVALELCMASMAGG